MENNDDGFVRFDSLDVGYNVFFGDVSIDFLYQVIADCFIYLGVKKIATIKVTGASTWKILVKCPHCKSVFYQKEPTRRFCCPMCMKKSPITTKHFVLSTWMLKKVNDVAKDNKPYETDEEEF